MPVCLSKGQKVSLTKDNPGLQKVIVGLGWDVNRYDTGGDFDLDASVFMLTDSGKVSRQEEFVFYGNPKDPSGAVQHMGDNRTGAGEGDDEQIMIDLTKVPENITKIAITVTIYDAESRRQNFGQSEQFVYPHLQRAERTGDAALRSGGGFLHRDGGCVRRTVQTQRRVEIQCAWKRIPGRSRRAVRKLRNPDRIGGCYDNQFKERAKGQSDKKRTPGLDRVIVGLGWDAAEKRRKRRIFVDV